MTTNIKSDEPWHYTKDMDFDFAPFACDLILGAVPLYPTTADFQRASMAQQGNESAIVRWYFEAIKIRLAHPGAPMDVIAPQAAERTKQWIDRMRARVTS